MSRLGGQVRTLLRDAVEVFRETPEIAQGLRDHLDRLDGPLRVAIAGQVKAGKSTLLNALVGERLAPTDAGECTRIVTWYRRGHRPRVSAHPLGGGPRQLRIDRVGGALRIDLEGLNPAHVERLVVDWPAQGLSDTILIDTPGIASLSADVSARANGFLAPDDEPSEADAVVYLMRHLHSADLRLLESFHDNGIARANPVNTIAVLSRADEIGVGRVDALMSAAKIARRYRTDPRLRRLCQGVVPVAGLLAETARSLHQQEFDALARMAVTSRDEVESALLSADRFVRYAGLGLLERFGLFGVRLSLALIRQGFGDPGRLAAELTRRSGVDELRAVFAAQFTQRRDLLKCRSALLAVDALLSRDSRPGTPVLRDDIERILAGAHEFTELRVLGALRSGAFDLTDHAADEAERLLGAGGAQPWSRLGLPADVGRDEQRAAVLDALARWQRQAENPLARKATVDVARVVVRSCEGMAADLAD
ncbi:dynamin family protein [Kutzneria buriramensis]|uniref:Dynamin family protein n=1 Tax=Kutzneria buriramensis TaxID=1045776 RepID=A0A3E0GYI1_9PSEU|nr:dynamin family protein [Kutzneria buriramensis]REH35170.1 dynamin family protein [Kutzneria buriramensis]